MKNKVVLITGAHNPLGIGAATAFKFAQEGANVVIVYNYIFGFRQGEMDNRANN